MICKKSFLKKTKKSKKPMPKSQKIFHFCPKKPSQKSSKISFWPPKKTSQKAGKIFVLSLKKPSQKAGKIFRHGHKYLKYLWPRPGL
jgi:hypothetical protein